MKPFKNSTIADKERFPASSPATNPKTALGWANLTGLATLGFSVVFVLLILVAWQIFIEENIWFAILLIPVPPLFIWSLHLWSDANRGRRATWLEMFESLTGQDLNRDGHVGAEPVGRWIPLNKGEDGFTLAERPEKGVRPRPFLHFPKKPPVTANDVVHIVERGFTEGLTYETWVNYTLPSGTKIGRTLWDEIRDGLFKWRFASGSKSQDGRVFAHLNANTWDDVEKMIRRIKQSVEADEVE